MVKTYRIAVKLSAVFLFVCSPALSLAVPIDVDPGAFQGRWRVQGQTAEIIGPAQVELAAGQYSMIIGTFGNFTFDVDGAGNVTSNNAGAAIGGASSLDFNTTVIHVDPGQFLVQSLGLNLVRWGISRVVKDVIGASDIDLVKGVNYSFYAGEFGGFFVTLDQNGNPTVNNGVSANVNGNTVTFNTVPVFVDPAQFLNQPYPGLPRWAIARVIKDATTVGTVNLVPGVRYGIKAGEQGAFFVQLDATGFVTVENGVSGVGGQQTLTFNTTSVSIDPGDFQNQVDAGATAFWQIERVISWTQGPASALLVPDLRYGIDAGEFGKFFMFVDVNGDVSASNGFSATGVGNTLTFNTETILVDPGTYTGPWNLSRVLNGLSGSQPANVVPGARYSLRDPVTSAHNFFDVASPCAVSPSTIVTTVGTFNISCGLLDVDGDGVPDANDNCPAIPNADQMDLDQDNLGDVCDSDLDGDGIDNTVDNCPDFANPGQADLDLDGIGDDCDDDTDGDSVVDINDNCPLIPNAGQGDNDADNMGDACDIDDDNDSVVDGADNCPLIANNNQADFDGNGVGDVCDDDIDGDGVLNDADDCAETSAGQAITPNGCSGSQFVELECPRESFVNHGQFVSCVAHTAQDLVTLGVITNKEKSIFVKQAAKNK